MNLKLAIMKNMKMTITRLGVVLAAVIGMAGCQDMDHPGVGDYPVDENPPGGPLKFYVPFDQESDNPLMVAVDQIRAKFPTENNFTTISGINENGVQGAADKMINYAKPNDWGSTADSFTISFWEKHDGQTKNGVNPGAEHIFSIPSSNGHWSSATMFLLFDAAPTTTATAVKFVMIDANMADTWMTWEGGNSIEGLLDNQWHHLAFVYDSSTSIMTLYIDGAVYGTKEWPNHGAINLDDSKITGFRIGNGPQSQNANGDNWLYSNWKGGLDQFRLYGTALSATEVQDLFANHQ